MSPKSERLHGEANKKIKIFPKISRKDFRDVHTYIYAAHAVATWEWLGGRGHGQISWADSFGAFG